MKLWFGLISLFCLTVYADDVIVIKGGREIHGQITAETETHLDVYTDYGRQLHIHKTRISNILRAGQANSEAQVNRVPMAVESLDAVAVSKNEKKWMLGMQLGVANSSVSINPAPTTAPASKSGMLIGALAEYSINDAIYFNPELSYSQLGYKSNSTTTVKYTFIKLPLLFKYKYPLFSKFYLNGFGGGSVGMLTGAIVEAANSNTDVSATTRSTIYSLELGAGAEYVFAERINLFLNLRYAMALNSVDNTPGDPRTYKLRDIEVLFGLLYRI